MRIRLALALAVSCLVLAGGHLAGQQKRVITDQDLLKFVWIADPQVSPDGRQVVYVRVVVNEKTDDYDTSLWTVPSDGHDAPRALTSGTRDSSPRFSPDGKRLAFVRAGAGQPPQIHVISLSGGEAAALTDLPKGAGAPAWSPDGTKIAFSSTTKPEDFEKKTDAAPKSDVRVITSAVYRANGGGWNDPDRPPHVWVTDATITSPLPKAKALTSGKYAEAGQGWSTDGTRVYFTSTREDEPYFHQSKAELFSVPAAGGEMTKVASINGAIGAVKPSPDGRLLAFVAAPNGTPERSYDQPDLFVTNADGSGTPRNLTTAFDFDINGSVGGDQGAPRGGRSAGPIWSADGKSIFVVAGRTRRREPRARQRRDRRGRHVPAAQADGALVLGLGERPDVRRAHLDADQHRRAVRGERRDRRGSAADHARQRRALQHAEAERARADHVEELRRQDH